MDLFSNANFLNIISSVAGLLATLVGGLAASEKIDMHVSQLLLAVLTGIIGWATKRPTTEPTQPTEINQP